MKWEDAFFQARKAVEFLYQDDCDIFEYRPRNGNINNPQLTMVAERVPCRLSYKTIQKSVPSTKITRYEAQTEQNIRLFLPPDIQIKAGSAIRIEHNGQSRDYICSGIAARYKTHQKIEVRCKQKFA